jgi:hypothetical protein
MGLLRGVARTAVVAGTATAVSNRVSRRQAGRWAQQQEDTQQEQEQYADPPAEEDNMQAKLDALRQLGELKTQGVLTEDEFQQQKAKILGT